MEVPPPSAQEPVVDAVVVPEVPEVPPRRPRMRVETNDPMGPLFLTRGLRQRCKTFDPAWHRGTLVHPLHEQMFI